MFAFLNGIEWTIFVLYIFETNYSIRSVQNKEF